MNHESSAPQSLGASNSRDLVRGVFAMEPKETERLYRKFLNPVFVDVVNFIGMKYRFVHAEGVYLKSANGKDYLDFLSGFGALNLGHEPAEVLEALREAELHPNILQSLMNPAAAKLAECLAEVTPGELCRSFFCNSGAEAVEAALKLARKATGRQVLLYAEGAFHGKTFGALSVSSRMKYRRPFEPLVPMTESVPYDDLRSLETRLSSGDVAGFIVEPVQGENGVIIPQEGYLKGAEELCRRYNTFLIVDEIQTGMGRTGKLFACEHERVEPDILVLSKSLGGGVMPIGAMITTDAIWKKAYGTLESGLLHSSTFGGNTRACVCALAALQAIVQRRLPENAEQVGLALLQGLKKLLGRFSVLKDVRGKGLMIGLSFARFKGKETLAEGGLTLWVARQLLKKYRILTAFTLNNYDVLRIAPPLTVRREQIDYFLASLEKVLASAEVFRFFHLLKSDNLS
jgi:putrescine aminotransferase